MSESKVVIDGRMVGPVPHGFSRYVSYLASGLSEFYAGGELPYEPVFLVGQEVPPVFRGLPVCKMESPFLHPAELVEIPRVLRSLKAALYHSPTFSSLLGAPCPWIATVHDLNHLAYGGWKQKAYYRYLLRPFLRKATGVLSVSEFSRREVADWAGIPLDSINIVYNAIDPGLKLPLPNTAIEEALSRHGLKRGRYFLCLANPKPHKNVELLVKAYEGYREKASPQKASNDPWNLALSLNGVMGEGLRCLGAVSEGDGPLLLAGAGALVSPSLYEGFGLPPVEAAARGVPILVSKIPPHEEGLSDLSADEAIWVEPRDLEGWVSALSRAADGGLRRVAVSTRSKILERFSPERLAREMDRIYRGVLEEPRD